MWKIFFILQLAVIVTFSANAQIESSGPIPVEIRNLETLNWFGPDFSLFRLSNKRKATEEESNFKYIDIWIKYYEEMVPNVKMASLLGIENVVVDYSYNLDNYQSFLVDDWIQKDRFYITEKDLKYHLKTYESKLKKGIGLTFIIENFHKGKPCKAYGYFVWFDIATNKIIHITPTSGNPSTKYMSSQGFVVTNGMAAGITKGMSGYWLQGMLDATLDFTIDFKLATKD